MSLLCWSVAAVLAAPLLLLTGCSSVNEQDKPWDPKWNAAVGNLEVRPSTTLPKAWQGANGVDVSTANRWAMDSYMWSGGDNVVGFAAGMVTSGIAKGQQRDFDERNADILPRLPGFFGQDLNRSLDQSVRKAVMGTSFKARLQPPHQSQLCTQIEQCGFYRVGLDASDNVLLTPFIVLKVAIVSQSPARCYLQRTIHKNAAETHRHTAREYVDDPAMTRRALQAVLDQFEFQIKGRLKQRLGEL